IIIAFGKNDNDMNKSLSRDTLDFFMDFPNIKIVHIPELHAKYYANEYMGLMTSMNLYDYSINNNIEFGIFFEHEAESIATSLLRKGFNMKNIDVEIWDQTNLIIKKGVIIYDKQPIFNNKEYIKSEILVDNINTYYGNCSTDRLRQENNTNHRRASIFNDSTRIRNKQPHYGYCIRTGIPIEFNPERPFCKEAYYEWAQWGNYSFQENFCHLTGEPSNGQTSMEFPILKKNWKVAREIFS
ncbi:MAG: hypothetical protein RSD40_05700, partial [Bacilli bacterium]